MSVPTKVLELVERFDRNLDPPLYFSSALLSESENNI